MSPALSAVDLRIDSRCLVSSLDKGGCAVGTDGVREPFRIIDLDHPAAPVRPTARKCDYLFLAEADNGHDLRHVVPLELKATALNAGTVTSQLQAGARIAEHLLGGKSSAGFIPVAAHGGKPHRRQYQALAKTRITFRGGQFPIMTTECGASLSWTLG